MDPLNMFTKALNLAMVFLHKFAHNDDRLLDFLFAKKYWVTEQSNC